MKTSINRGNKEPKKWEPNMEEQAAKVKQAYKMEDKKEEKKSVVADVSAPVDPMIFDKKSPYYEKPKGQPVDPMNFDVPAKSIEEKTYIIFVVGNDLLEDDMFDGFYKVCEGRTKAYRFIQHLIESYGDDIDPHQSKVITQTIQTETDSGDTKYYMIDYDSAISVYAFCKTVEVYYGDTAFDIDTYYPALVSDKDTTKKDNNIVSAVDNDAVARAYLNMTTEQRSRLKDPMDIEGEDANLIIKEAAERFNKQNHYKVDRSIFDDQSDGEQNV